MIKDLNLRSLELQLTTAKVSFKQEGNYLKLLFNDYSNPLEFSHDLVHLQNDFSNEFILNLSNQKSVDSKLKYLEFVKKVFISSIEKLGNNAKVFNPHLCGNNYKTNDTYNITTDFSDVSELISYFCIQKNIIIKAIKLIECNRSIIRESFPNRVDYFPYISRLKNELSTIKSIPSKIIAIDNLRKKLVDELSLEGIDLYDSPLNMYFEACLFSIKDTYILFLDNPDSGKRSLQWTAQTVDFLELILALDQSQCLSLKEGGPVSRKELIAQLSAFFNIEPISNYESRLNKFKTRVNKTPFLDKLKEVFMLFTDGDRIK